MFVYGVSFTDVHRVVRDVSDALYDGNITVRTGEDRTNGAGPRATFTLRSHDTTERGRQGKCVRVRQGHRPER